MTGLPCLPLFRFSLPRSADFVPLSPVPRKGRPMPRLTPAPPPTVVEFGRDVCGSLPASESREWLVANGIGGFASGTVAGLLTRGYHGLLVASLGPPAGRTLLVSKVEESA